MQLAKQMHQYRESMVHILIDEKTKCGRSIEPEETSQFHAKWYDYEIFEGSINDVTCKACMKGKHTKP